jgi:hypothetical protein
VSRERLVLALLLAGLVGLAATTRVTEFWADGATYHGMAWSLAEDLDLRFEARDALRARREFPSGPQGIFLKRTWGGLVADPDGGFPWLRPWHGEERDKPVYYAKSFAYPLVAAPLVKLMGTRGLLVTNAVCVGVALLFGFDELRRRTKPGEALLASAAFFLATVAPIYVVWLTPEAFNLGVVAGSLWALRRDRPVLSAVLLGLAAYSKPYNVLLALPLGALPLVEGWRAGRPLAGLLEGVRRAMYVTVTVVALFGLNVAATGEANYQGGERKTFYGKFPFEEHLVTFGNTGIWMTTDQLGPLVQGTDEAKVNRRTGPARDPAELDASLRRNLGYFWVGRFGGVIPYFLPAALATLLFLLRGPRTTEGWLALVSLLGSVVFYVWMIPDNWYGGGGTIGNRYFLSLLPLCVLLLPAGSERLVAAAGLVSGLALAPLLWRPVEHSLHPGEHTFQEPFRRFPPELTMLNDLAVFTEPWRKKRPYGDTEGDPATGRRADPGAHFLYFLDDGTCGKQAVGKAEGFVLRAGQEAELVLRSLEPVQRAWVSLAAGAPDAVKLRLGSAVADVDLAAGASRELALEPGPGFPYYDTWLYRLDLRSTAAPVDTPCPAPGTGVSLRLETVPRPR